MPEFELQSFGKVNNIISFGWMAIVQRLFRPNAFAARSSYRESLPLICVESSGQAGGILTSSHQMASFYMRTLWTELLMMENSTQPKTACHTTSAMFLSFLEIL